MSAPTKAYLITYKIVNECEAVVHADSLKGALEAFAAGRAEGEATGVDYRIGIPKAKRFPQDDL